MRRVTLMLCCGGLFALGLPGCAPPANRIIGAGDIAGCAWTNDSKTADVIDSLGGTVVTFGDNAYQSGTSTQFKDCYKPTWGRHDARVRPAPGNHDYLTPGASGYFGYFGSKAGPTGRGYYHYDVGSWRVFSLNSEANIPASAAYVRANAGGKKCIAAYWHKPFVSSGPHGNDPSVKPLWEALYDVGGDIVLNGHDHDYERFAELGRSGLPQAAGMREFVVGTGGAGGYPIGTPKPGSERRGSGVFGVISINLNADGYAWRFHPIEGQSFADSGSGNCA